MNSKTNFDKDLDNVIYLYNNAVNIGERNFGRNGYIPCRELQSFNVPRFKAFVSIDWNIFPHIIVEGGRNVQTPEECEGKFKYTKLIHPEYVCDYEEGVEWLKETLRDAQSKWCDYVNNVNKFLSV